MVSKALDVFGDQLLIGYDIGCSFQETVHASSLGPAFRELMCRFCVNAFHGYAHNFKCQSKNHPNVIEGMGLEDLETMEHIFSSSNQLGSLTRYMTAYNRRVYIDLSFKQWDNEKYQNLGDMLFNNYTQAVAIIRDDSVAVTEAMKALQIQESDLEKWQKEQVEYFETLGNEAEGDLHAIAYVELLQQLRDIKYVFSLMLRSSPKQ
jgi:hypothetical protein